jgi:hypothetical protein
MRTIAVRHFGNSAGPSNAQTRVLSVQCPFGLRRVQFGMEVQQFAVIRQRLEAMGEALRDEKTPIILCGENFSVPAQKGL